MTSEGIPHCCLFPKMNWSIVLEQRTCHLQLKAARLFRVTLGDSRCLHTDMDPEASMVHPSSFISLCASAYNHWHGFSSQPWGCGTGCSPALNPFPQVLPLERPCSTILYHTPPSVHTDPRPFTWTGFPHSTSPCLVLSTRCPRRWFYFRAWSPVWCRVETHMTMNWNSDWLQISVHMSFRNVEEMRKKQLKVRELVGARKFAFGL